MGFFGIGLGELLFIIIIALIFVGPGKIAEIGKTLGKTVRAIRKTGTDFTSAVTRELDAEEKIPPSKQPPKDNSTAIQKTTPGPAPPESENSNNQPTSP
jgi:sec-independent protein translocase protein TatA